MAPRPPLILLAGMHRSGTSLLASLLPCFGISLPGELIQADIHNPEGYFERADITDLQETLQIDLGRWWPSASGDLPTSEHWLSLPSSRRAAQQIEACLRLEQARQTSLWAIKDPRLSLLLPLWERLSRTLDQPLRLVISIRDPAEVMVSLTHRDGPLTGMTPWRAQRLIWRHLHQLLLDSPALPTLVVAFGDWFEAAEAERQLGGLARFCRQNEPGAEQLHQALQRIVPEHRRSLRAAGTLPLAIHPLLQELQARLSRIARLEPHQQEQPLAELRQWLRQDTPRQLPPHPDRQSTATGDDEAAPWFDAAFYRQQCQQRGLTPAPSALAHFQAQGWPLGLSPNPIADPLWAELASQRHELWPAGKLEGLHPWGAAALALSGDDVFTALVRLRAWLRDGLSAADLEAIAAADAQQFRLLEAAFDPDPALSGDAELWLLGSHQDDPRLADWRQQLPLPTQPAVETGARPRGALGLSLGPLPPGPGSFEALKLARAALVFDPDPERVALWRRLGINARLLPGRSDVPPAPSAEQLEPAETTVASSDAQATAAPSPPRPGPGSLARRIARKLRRASFLHLYPIAPGLHTFFFFTLRRKAIATSQLIRARQFSSIPRIFLSDIDPAQANHQPLVSVIVPNYNHAAYLEARLASIFEQTYTNFEVILLDDASTDGSQDILRAHQSRHPERCRLVINEHNSGSPFRQWRHGLDLARGELIWIAESDDFCAPNFLSELVPFFTNPATMLAFCQIQFVAENGRDPVWSMQQYLPELGTEFWQQSLVSSAHRLTGRIWNRRNLIPNVSAALFRRCPELPLLQDPAWLGMQVCGDWLFYLQLARGGLVGYSPDTTSYYRQHPQNSSVSRHRQRIFLEEHLQLAEQLLRLYRLSPDDCLTMQEELRQRWQTNHDAPLPVDLQARIDALGPSDPSDATWRGNILIVVYSMIAGGGEILPIQLANILKTMGFGVSVLNCHQHPNQPGVLQMLRRDIPLIELRSLETLSTIIDEFGIDIVHSHHPWVDTTISEILHGNSDVCHVITSHGMYDELDAEEIARVSGLLGPWVKQATYVADRNLDALQRIGFQPHQTTKIANAIAQRRCDPITRASLGLSDTAFVVCLASRGIREKGWQEAIEAVQLARLQSSRDVQLLILGDGKELHRLQPLHREESFLHFLGFQDNASRFFACADIGILPSFYPGESQPLTLIECLAAGRPYLASDLGEIGAMLSTPEGLAGQVIPLEDGRVNSQAFATAILRYLQEPMLLQRHTSLASLAAAKFDPVAMGQAYAAVYHKALTTNASPTCGNTPRHSEG